MGLLLVSGYSKIYFLLPKRRYNIPIVSNLALEEPANLTKSLFHTTWTSGNDGSICWKIWYSAK